MCTPTSGTPLATFLLVDSRWHEPHNAVQCRAHGSTFKFLFEFQTEFFSNFLFEFQVVQASNCSTIEGPLYFLFMDRELSILELQNCYQHHRTGRNIEI